MSDRNQAVERIKARAGRPEDEPRYIVGMDAHSRKLALSIWDWSDRWNGIVHREFKCVDINDMVTVYERHIDLDSLTIIEASTNSTSLKRKLNEAGFRAEVVRADAVAGREGKRKIYDLQDARNLAQAYMKGDIREFVWTPSEEHSEMRDLALAYRDTTKDMERTSNRIWSICSQHGFPLPLRCGVTKAASIRELIKTLDAGKLVRKRLDMMVSDYERLMKRKKELEEIIAETVVSHDAMLRLMQLPGVYMRTAFITHAIVEDVTRFPTAAKLVAYAGLSPSINTSGEEEERAKANGGTGKPLDGEGRRDLKFYFTEAGNTVINSCKTSSLGKWGWRLINRGKPKNKAVCAVGHKLVTYAWHIMRGDPTPNRESEALFKRKLMKFGCELGKERLRELGYKTRAEFAEKIAARYYDGLPPLTDKTERQQ